MTRRRPSTAAQLAFGEPVVIDPLQARLNGLRTLARQIYVDRNAQGMPQRERLTIKAQARPLFRGAIRALRASRDALQAGNLPLHEHHRDVARMNFAFGRIEFFRPFAHEVDRRDKKIADRSREAAESAAAALTKAPDLPALIRACFERGESIRPYVKQWAREFGIDRSTVYRKAKKVRLDMDSGN